MIQGLREVQPLAETAERNIDWPLVDTLEGVLAEVVKLGAQMQKKVYVMGDLFRDLYLCREAISLLQPQKLDLLQRNTVAVLSSVTYAAAIVCDPLYNTQNTFAIDEGQREEAIVSG